MNEGSRLLPSVMLLCTGCTNHANGNDFSRGMAVGDIFSYFCSCPHFEKENHKMSPKKSVLHNCIEEYFQFNPRISKYLEK